MINTVECFIATCDNCKEHFENVQGFGIFADEQSMKQDMQEEGWHIIDDKDYCDQCAKLDDEIDDKVNIDLSRFVAD